VARPRDRRLAARSSSSRFNRHESGHYADMRTKLTFAAACAVSAAVLAGPAEAEAKLWKGKTAQGRLASVRTGADGLVVRVRIRWRARCGDRTTLTGTTAFAPPLDRSETRRFEDGGSYPARVTGGLRSQNTVFVRGSLARNGPWRGTFHVRSRITRRGQTVTRCRLGRTRWTARRVS
jgi:hypothetical protein